MPSFTNQASLLYNNTVTNSNVVVGNLIETLSVTKNALINTYSRGDSITYVVAVTNSGTSAYNDITLTDDLGAYSFDTVTLVPLTYIEGSLQFYLNGVLQPAPSVSLTDGLVITGIDVPAGGTALFVYQTEANEFAPLDVEGAVTNTVTVTGATVTESVTASETVSPETEASLSISKAICPATVTENGQITYTFVIQNTGNTPTVATDNLTLTDTFDPILQNIVVTYNDELLTPGTDYTYINGVFTVLNGVISVPAATYTRTSSGNLIVDPGVSVITVTGTI